LVLDFRNLTRGELIAGLAGIALFVIMLAVDWYGINVFVIEFGEGLRPVEWLTRNAFQAFTVVDLVLLLTALAAVALPLWSALGRPATGPLRPGASVAALGGLAFALIAFRLISLPDLFITAPGGQSGHVGDDEGVAEVTRKVGPWLGFAATALIAYGGYRSMRHPASAPRGETSLPPRGKPLETA
jgi:hypothetical protein